MEKANVKTNHNLWFRLAAKAEADPEFKEKLLANAGHMLEQEKKELQKAIMTELINDPDKMEQVFGNPENFEETTIEEMEERLAAFGYIGW